jgi:hypothetical protein
MNAEYSVVQILLATTAVTNIVGTRVHLNQAPQNAVYPLIIVDEEDVEPKDSKDGVSVLDMDIIKVYPYAESKNTLRLLAQACRSALDNKTPGVYATYTIRDVRFMGQTSFDEQIENRDVYAKDQTYNIWVVQ